MKVFLAAACLAATAIVIVTADFAASAQTVDAVVLAHIIASMSRVRRLTTRQLMEKLAIKSRETLRKLQRKPAFPQPLYDEGSPVKFFLEHEADAYLQQLAEARDRANRPRTRDESDGRHRAEGARRPRAASP